MVIWQQFILVGIALVLLIELLLSIFKRSGGNLILKKKFIFFLFISSLISTLINPALQIIYLEVHILVILFLCVALIKFKNGEAIKFTLLMLGFLLFILIGMYLVYPFFL
ncbi:hypothetical protein CSV73_09525 [Sporosarcina sp. P1]|nr:hypothetical protein CSV73_09525 [Sporosarcina sp. P1]